MKVTFANEYTTPGGRKYNAGTTAEINDNDARHLIFRGKARKADPEPAQAKAEGETEASVGHSDADDNEGV